MKQKEYHSFNVKFIDNEFNWKTVEEFKLFCKNTTSNGYLQGIRNLLLTNKMLKYMMEQEDERIQRKNREENKET